jgi:ABC-2 type transport system ATP-binding protein
VSTVEATGVAKHYGSGRTERRALVDVNFTAHAGEIIGIVGPNGAGKTTLLGLIAGDLELTSGTLTVGGHRAGTRAARRLVGYAPDPPLLPPELTGTEWLSYLASHRASTPRDRLALVRQAVELAELGEFVGRRVNTYSRGMAQRLALAAAALTGPVLVLDEILSGIDPLVQRRLRGQIAELAREGRVVLLASHDLGAVERVATRVFVLMRGRIVADVQTGALLAERVAELTLSGSALSLAPRLLDRFRGAVRTGQGVAVPLVSGLTVEEVLAVCREIRVPVAGSRVRYRALEDLLVAAGENGG